MRLHLLKPLHGWRAFIGEIVIIVVGVLIALSAEQIVDDWNWRRTIEAQRKALDEDVSGMWNAMSARVVVQPCVDRRLSELDLVFQRHDRGLPPNIIAPIGRPAVWTGSQAALRMATADGSLSHMSLGDKRAYFSVAESYDTFAPAAREERASWRVLQGLNEPAALDATDWRELRSAYRDAIDSNRVMKSNLVSGTPGQWLTAFARFGRHADNKEALTLPVVQELCRPAVQQ
jgi:hypothetical protein